MILSATLSKPAQNIEEILGKPFIKIKISYENSSSGASYFLHNLQKLKFFTVILKKTNWKNFYKNMQVKLLKIV